MNEATISADVIGSSSFFKEDAIAFAEHLRLFVEMLPSRFPGSWGRIVRGDGFECIMEDPRNALRVALLLRCHVKSFMLENAKRKSKGRDIRIAIGLGGLNINDEANGVIDGAAIYNSGRALERMSQRSNMVIECLDDVRRVYLQLLLNFIDGIFLGATARQCDALYHWLLEGVVKVSNGLSRTGMYDRLKKLNWQSIKEALDFYERYFIV